MERGRELSQAVATFILQKILLDDYGLNFICDPERGTRFKAVNSVLSNVVNVLAQAENPSLRLLKHTIRCYHRFCDHPAYVLFFINIPFISIIFNIIYYF